MLDLFRRKKSGLKWILWIVILALSGGMLLLFVDVPTGVGVTPGNLDVAVVAGKRVTVAEYQRAFGRLYDVYSQNYRLFSSDPAVLNQLGLPKQALDGLINRHAISYEATRLGLSVSPQETVDHIATNPIFQENGKFIGIENYKLLLQHSNLSTTEYEQSVQMDILAQKLQNLLTDGIMPTLEEAYQEFVSRNQKVQLHYLAIDPNKIKPSQVTKEDLQAHFSEHQNEYKIEEKRKIAEAVDCRKDDAFEKKTFKCAWQTSTNRSVLGLVILWLPRKIRKRIQLKKCLPTLMKKPKKERAIF